MPFNPIPDHKERGFDIMFGEDIKQLMGIRRTRSIIKGERDNPLMCVQVNNVLSEGRSEENPQQSHCWFTELYGKGESQWYNESPNPYQKGSIVLPSDTPFS
jgi:hypothetical protein